MLCTYGGPVCLFHCNFHAADLQPQRCTLGVISHVVPSSVTSIYETPQMDAAADAAADSTEEVPEPAAQHPAPCPTFEEELAFCCAYATGLLQGVEDPAVQSSLPLHPANVSEACSNGYILW